MRLAQTRMTHHRAGQTSPPDAPPGMDTELAGSYFPDSRVASHGEWVSPLSFNSRAGAPVPAPLDIVTVPRGGESPWLVPAQSDEQGVGRSPGQDWPWQVISEAYNFDQLQIMPFEWEQAMPPGNTFPGGWAGRNPPDRSAAFNHNKGLTHSYYEQDEGYVTSDTDQIAVLPDPQQAAYTIGWGALDNPAGGSIYPDDGYGY